ncbi:MAG TPA: CpsB/CapC family capsule biosynthesis tyrosine phosphatase [Tepidisphaeraceae bacterium]|nr:CpsB/CapC family capsule biosynthesis tyrosine phosphatase [Tepidisphaeraceae bacterium]
MMDRIDVHCHLLPAVDDGCPNLQVSIECAKMLVGAGYSHCFCTPHAWPNLPNQTRSNVAQLTVDLQQALSEAGISLTLLPGSELNLNPKVMETPEERIISMGLAGKFILVDMWANKLPEWFVPTIQWLQQMKLTVILAHPERMRAIQDDPTLAEQLSEMGILLQGNLQCFADHPDSYTRMTAEKYLTEKRYFVLGSDTHSVDGLKHRLTGLRNATQLVGEAEINRLTRDNPRQLLP